MGASTEVPRSEPHPWRAVATVTLVDLRWGVHTTAAEGERELDILQVCLDEVARTRPLFLGLLGDRYGWVPDAFTAQTAAGRRDFPRSVTGRSVTELEIEYGVLHDSDRRGSAAFFFRSMTPEPPAGFAEAPGGPTAAALGHLKQRIRESDATVIDYGVAVEADGSYPTDEFERLALDAVWTLIAPHLGEDATIDPDDRVHDGFAAELSTAFVDPDARISRVLRRVDERPDTVHVITGAVGNGRSSTLAALAARYRTMGGRTLFHSVPLERAGTRTAPQRLVALAGLAPTASVRDALLALAADSVPVLVCLDAIDRSATEAERAVTWLPDPLPPHVRVVVSCDTWPRYASRSVDVEVIDDLFPELVARAIIEDRFARLSKVVPATVVDVLAPRATVAGPLWTSLAADVLAGLDATDFATVDQAAPDRQAALTAMVEQVARGLDPLLTNLFSTLFERAERSVAADALHAVSRAVTFTTAGAPSREVGVIASALAGRPLDDLEIARVRWALRGQIATHGETEWLSPAHDVFRRTVFGATLGDETTIRATIARALAPIRETSPFASSEFLAQSLVLASAGGVARSMTDAASGGHVLRGEAAVRLLADRLAAGDGAAALIEGVVADPALTPAAGWLVRDAVYDSADRGAGASTAVASTVALAGAVGRRARIESDHDARRAWLDLEAEAIYDRAHRAEVSDDEWIATLELASTMWHRLTEHADDTTAIAVRLANCRTDLARALATSEPARATGLLDETADTLLAIDLAALPAIAPRGTDRQRSRVAVVLALASVDDARAFVATDGEAIRHHLRQQLIRLWSLHEALHDGAIADGDASSRLDQTRVAVLDDLGRAAMLLADASAFVDDGATLATLDRAIVALDEALVAAPATTRLVVRIVQLHRERAALLERVGDLDGARRSAAAARSRNAVVAALAPDDAEVVIDTIRCTALSGELEARHGDVVAGSDLLQSAGELALAFLDPDLGSATTTDARSQEVVIDTILRILETWVVTGLTARFADQEQRFFEVGNGLMTLIDQSDALGAQHGERLHARLAASRSEHFSLTGDHGRATVDLSYVLGVADELVAVGARDARWFRSDVLEVGVRNADRAGDRETGDRYLRAAIADADELVAESGAPAAIARRRHLQTIAATRTQ